MSETTNTSKSVWRKPQRNSYSSSSSEIDSSDTETLSTSEQTPLETRNLRLELVCAVFAPELVISSDGENSEDESSEDESSEDESSEDESSEDESSEDKFFVAKEEHEGSFGDEGISEEKSSVRRMLSKIVDEFKTMEILPDLIGVLIAREKMNYMILDLYDYDKGYGVSFCNVDDEERFHGIYSYAVGVIDYVKAGEIPYELLDKILDYEFQIFYDGYVACMLRFHFHIEENVREHFVLLNQTIQTIDGECAIRLANDSSLDFDELRARLIHHYAPDLCLEPDRNLAEILIANELNQSPFITPYLNSLIQNEKISKEKIVDAMSEENLNFIYKEEEEEESSFALSIPSEEVADLTKCLAENEHEQSILSFVKTRKICFPILAFLTGSHVEIESFEYDYHGQTRGGKIEQIRNKLSISVLDEKEFYFGAFGAVEKMQDSMRKHWWKIGNRKDLDLTVTEITKKEMLLCCGDKITITHNQNFDEQVSVNLDEPVSSTSAKLNIVCLKPDQPISKVFIHLFDDQN